eukprot:14787883-Alexandrium_andersonii.AAC.1
MSALGRRGPSAMELGLGAQEALAERRAEATRAARRTERPLGPPAWQNEPPASQNVAQHEPPASQNA